MRHRRWAIFVALFAMVVAACAPPGGDDTTETTAADTGATETTQAAADTDTTQAADDDAAADDGAAADEDPLVIGALLPLTGTVAGPGADAVAGLELFFEQNGDTFGGRKVEFVVEDTASDPDTAKQKLTKLIEVDQADIIIPGILANVGLAVVDQVRDDESILTVSPYSCNDDFTQRTPIPRYVRAGGWSCSQTSHVLGAWAAENGFDTVATACTDYAFGHELCGGFVDVYTEMGGTLIDQLWFPLGPQDFSTYNTQLLDLGVDAAMILPVGASAIDWMQTWSDFGLKDQIPLLAGEVVTDQSVLRNMTSDIALGTISAGHWAEGGEIAETQEFVELYEAATGNIPSYYSAANFAAAQWIAATLEETGGEFEPDSFLETMKGLEVRTPFGPQRLDDTGNPIFNVYIREVTMREDGKLWNTVIETFENVDQYWPKTREEYLAQPVYTRDFQGVD